MSSFMWTSSACNRRLKVRSRREFLATSSFGFGSMALSYLLGGDLANAATISGNDVNPLAVKPPHFPAKAKRVIFVFLQGGPSQVDTFDPKARAHSPGWPVSSAEL